RLHLRGRYRLTAHKSGFRRDAVRRRKARRRTAAAALCGVLRGEGVLRMRAQRGWAWVFTGPALFLIAIYLVYPAISTIYLSFFDRRSEVPVGFRNYVEIFTSQAMLTAFRNNLLWLVVFTAATVCLGLLLAVL